MSNFMAVLSMMGSEIPQTIFRCRRRFLGTRRLDGKVVVITGGNAGIGKEAAYQLSLRGPKKIIIGSRNTENNEKAVNEIKSRNPGANITALKLDLSSLKSVREFAKQITESESKVDILVNNAGVPVVSGPAQESVDGYEMQFAGCYLGHFLLSLHLLPLMRKSSDARIINVASVGHLFGQIYLQNINLRNGAYTAGRAHHQAKLAQVLFTREMARRLGGGDSSVKTYAVNPGMINSRREKSIFVRFLKSLLLLGVEMGPQTYLYCALDEALDHESGFYYDNCQRVDRMVSHAVDDKTAYDLWELSADLVKLETQYRI
ncbi:unnamed protein product [Oppiella nova]|uniref:Short-chain dehydrogenase n=1 Tax=Oppiella nova TaxID=334625 RepID=A0A7R9MEV0_9ACAR|nr:unnamed protein product [Oppiella nova]CAG2176092.1 unnamed protein product [Oppiella nova]